MTLCNSGANKTVKPLGITYVTVQYACTVYGFEDVPQNVCCYILPLSERIAIPSASISVSTYIQWILVFKVGILAMKLIILFLFMGHS